jgi:nucleoside-diphosphate-sugar epimerase
VTLIESRDRSNGGAVVKVFVAGATGAVGEPLVRQLVEAGHEVVGTTRSDAKAQRLRDQGAEPVLVDAFDVEAMCAAVRDARAEVVIHELTALPAKYDMRDPEKFLGATMKLRAEVGPPMVEAAAEAGARRFIAQSIAFMYTAEGSAVKDEGDPLRHGELAVDGTVKLERAVLQTPGIEGVVLRYGQFYGPGTYFARDGHIGMETRKRRFPIIGKGTGVFSLIHVEDAAAATVAALDHGSPGIYNITDDEPAKMRDLVPVYAELLGAKKPMRVPVWLARVAAGKIAAEGAAYGRGASNAKAKRELGWTPRYSSWRQGFAEAMG